jgi:hypothetical protein
MAIKFTTLPNPSTFELGQLQKNIVDAFGLVPAGNAALSVVSCTGNYSCTGKEDVILVNLTGTTSQVQVLLPNPAALQRQLTVRVTAAGMFPLVVKAMDKPGATKIDGSDSASVSGLGVLRIISGSNQFWTV